jgi:hypothetical protein
VPSCIQFSAQEQRNLQRGTHRVAVLEDQNGCAIMNAVSFIDCKAVTILSTSDGTDVVRMSRRTGSFVTTFDSRESVSNYGKFMGGVDTFDRYLSRFSMVKGHSFKKWYKKLGLSVVHDLALNAFFSWRLAKGVVSNSRDAAARDEHSNFICNLVQELFFTDWSRYDDESVLVYNEQDPMRDIATYSQTLTAKPAEPQAKHCSPHSKAFTNNSSGKNCKICWYEMRPMTKQTQYCAVHGVSLCTISYVSWPTDPTFMTDVVDTCWSKFHNFYLPQGVFEKMAKSIRLNNTHPFVVARKKFLASLVTNDEKIYFEGHQNVAKNFSSKQFDKLSMKRGRAYFSEMFTCK